MMSYFNKIIKLYKIYYRHLTNKLIKLLFHRMIMKRIACGGRIEIGLTLKNMFHLIIALIQKIKIKYLVK